MHLLLALILPIATSAKSGHLSSEAFINGISGFYEIDPKLLFGNWQHIKWYTVQIKWNQAKGAFTWQNREAVTWTLTPLMGAGGSWDETKLLVGNECPYRYEGHEFAKIEWVSLALFFISSIPDSCFIGSFQGTVEGSAVVTTIWGPWNEPYLRDWQGTAFVFDNNTDATAAIANKRTYIAN